MASGKKKNRRPGRAGRAALAIFVLLIALALGAGALNAAMVRVRRAEVRLADLPPAFDGATLLYASDIDLCGLNTPARSADLFARLQKLKPDILLLGGDYASASLFDILNREDKEKDAGGSRARAEFLGALASFEAPLGKFAIRAPEDGDPDGLAAALEAAGIHPLFDASVGIRAGGDTLYLAGLCGDAAPIARAAMAAKKGDCVVAVLATPALIPQVMINEVAGGGTWCDMILAGHTHGGQIRLGSATALSLNGVEKNYLAGWRLENGVPMLTTTGVGCEGLNVRLGTGAEVWLITLRRAE